MISLIIAIIAALWLIYKRFLRKEVLINEPLGLPKGTIRAYLSLIIVALPLHFLFLQRQSLFRTSNSL